MPKGTAPPSSPPLAPSPGPPYKGWCNGGTENISFVKKKRHIWTSHRNPSKWTHFLRVFFWKGQQSYHIMCPFIRFVMISLKMLRGNDSTRLKFKWAKLSNHCNQSVFKATFIEENLSLGPFKLYSGWVISP